MKIYAEGSLPTDETGTPVISQSLVNAWCQNPINVYYRYILGLSPKDVPEHIIRGLWMKLGRRSIINGSVNTGGQNDQWRFTELYEVMSITMIKKTGRY